MSFDRILFGLHNRAAHGVHWRPQHVAYSAPIVPPMHVGRVHTVGQGSSPPGGVVPPAPAPDFNPSPAPGATSSRLPLVLLGLGLAGAVVYIYMHQREDQARFHELERELEHERPPSHRDPVERALADAGYEVVRFEPNPHRSA